MDTIDVIKIILYLTGGGLLIFISYRYYKVIKKSKERKPFKYITLENLPHQPFSERVEIVLDVPEDVKCELLIVNDQNEICSTLHEGTLHTGYHKFSWDTNTLSNNFYYLTLKSEHQLTEKRVLIKNQ